MRFFISVLLAMFVVPCAGAAPSGELEDVCGRVYRKLESASHESLTRSMENFDYDGSRHHGCVIRLSGDAIPLTDREVAGNLFGSTLPYCLGGRLPADLSRDMINPDGWCADAMADGPNGTAYTALGKNVFCAVEGSWDGGDDSDPDHTPSPHYEVTVKCANR